MKRLLPLVLLTLGCPDAEKPEDTSVDTGFSTAITCTCRYAIVAMSATLDGVAVAPDRIALSHGETDGLEEQCGPATEPCTSDTLEASYSDTTCLAEAQLGEATLQLLCEDYLSPPGPCICGQDATLDFAFTSATTAP